MDSDCPTVDAYQHLDLYLYSQGDVELQLARHGLYS